MVELQQDGNPVLGSNGVQLSCIVKAEDDEIVDRVLFQIRSGGNDFDSIIMFNIKENVTVILRPGSYLEGRVILKNLLSSENRTVVEYNAITCEDNTAYKCLVILPEDLGTSEKLSLEVKGIVSHNSSIICQMFNYLECLNKNVSVYLSNEMYVALLIVFFVHVAEGSI